MHEAGYTLTERDPDYVVLGETRIYSFGRITQAIRLIVNGARFIATNPDATGPSNDGPLPATGSVAALISRATGVDPYFVGKPNPFMMRSALNALDAHSETTAMIGDRMDTDVVSGLEAGLQTILVLTGVTTPEEADRFPFRASRVVDSIADLVGRARLTGYGTSMARGLLVAAIAAIVVAFAAGDARACTGPQCYVQATTLGEAPATDSGVLRFPQAIAYSPGASTILVADQYGSVVQRFDRTGAWLGELGGYADAGQLGRIGVVGGLATDRAGHVYVLDSENDRVQVFESATGR